MAGEGWARLRLGEFVTLQRGHDLPDEQRRPGSVPILGSFGITGWHDTAKAPGPGVTVGRSGASFGVVSFTPRDYWPLNTALYVINFHGNDPRFAYYFLKQFDFSSYNSGSAQPSLNRNFIHPVSVEVPPPDEQHAIADILGTLDDKIELNRRMNETLEAMARALFKSWFVDFDPVRAKAAGRNPGLPQPLADLFPDSFEHSELGEIPKGWQVERLGNLSDLDKGLSYKGEGLADDGGLPMVNLGCFAGGGVFNAQNIKRYRGDFKERHLVRPGDLLVANTDMTQNRVILGSPALIPELGGEQRYLFTHHTYAFRFKSGAEHWRRYLYFSLLQPEFREIAEGFATGTTVLALPRDGLLNLPLVLPPEPVLAAFERQVEPIFAAVSIRREQSRTLSACRDGLLPKLISGELRVA